MTTKSISDQVSAIKKATEKASESKEAATAFLRRAGIIGTGSLKVIKAEAPNDYSDWKVEAVIEVSQNIFSQGSYKKATAVGNSTRWVSRDATGSPVKATVPKSGRNKKAVSKTAKL